jgi:hypothetical protein
MEEKNENDHGFAVLFFFFSSVHVWSVKQDKN